MSRRIWLVRHGDTFAPGEAPRRIGSRTDLPLTAGGQAQAQRLARMFAQQGVVFDSAYAGPLARARQTALTILAAQDRVPAAMAELQEIDHGPDEGLDEQAVRERVGAAALVRWDRCGDAPEGWIVDSAARIAGWQRFFAQQAAIAEAGEEAGDCLCVSSNGALRFALLALHRAHGIALPPSLAMRTGAHALIAIDRGGAVLAHWNQRPDQ